MKILLMILLFIAFIGPSVDENKPFGLVFKDAVFNYLSSVDKTINYLSENYEVFKEIKDFPFRNNYEEVMKDRVFVKHTIESGQTLDNIIKMYNSNINDIENFRKVVLYENPEAVSSDYTLKSGLSILVPSEM